MLNSTWQDNSSNETGFIIERKTGDSASAAPFTAIDSVGSNLTSYIDSTLGDTTAYTFRVKAYNQFIQTSYSNTASVTTVLSTLASPTNLTAVLSSTQVNRAQLNWQDNSSNETGFIIERKTGDSSSAAPYTAIDSVGSNLTSYIDSTLADTTAYTFRVKGYNQFIQTSYSNTASVTTVLSTLASPTNLTAVLSSTQVNRAQLNWQDNSSNETGFIIERKTGDSSSAAPYTAIDSVGSNLTSYIDSTLADTTAYTFRVKGYNQFIQTSYSNTASVTTVLSTLASPTNLTAVLSSTQVNRAQLNWQDNSSNETGFIIERKTGDSSSAAPYTAIDSVGSNLTSYIDSTLADTTAYTFRVKGYNQFIQTSYSNTASVTTVLSTLASPTNLTAVLSSTQVNRAQLNWQDNSSNETGFIIERKTGDSSSAAPYTAIDSVGSNLTSYIDSTLADTTAYTFRVKGYNQFIQTSYSNTASVTTVLSTLASPTNLTAVLSSTQVNRAQLNWQDNSSNETGFIIERKTGDSSSAAPYTAIDSVGSNLTSYIDSTLADTTAYTFRVKGYNQFIQTSYSNTASVTTVLSTLASPTNLTAVLSSTQVNRAQLNWQDNSSNETGFIIERKTGDSSSAAPYTAIDSVGSNLTSYIDSTLADTTAYTFRVKAFNSFIQSGYTNLASVTTSKVLVSIKIFMEGPCIADTMSTALNSGGKLPTHHPYNTIPWNYMGTDSVVSEFYSSNSSIVDWILIELWNSLDSTLVGSTRAALLKNDGVVVDTDGINPVSFNGIAAGNYYIIIKHRNHLETISSAPVALSTSSTLYDFTSDSSKAFGGNMVQKGAKWCIYGGDVNHDGLVDVTDLALTDIDNINFVIGYTKTDVNCDGLVDLTDLGIVDSNNLNFVSKVIPMTIMLKRGSAQTQKSYNGMK